MNVTRPKQIGRECKNLIGGEWRSGSGKVHTLVSPYTGDQSWKLTHSISEDVNSAVLEASKAFPAWRLIPIKDRTSLLFKFRELLIRDLDEISNVAAFEAGKTFSEAKAGLLKGIEVLEFATSLQNTSPLGVMEVSRGVWCEAIREPLGVVAGITPFNFPAMVPLWMYPIAIAVGNCFILKPSEKVPCTSSLIGERIIEAGFPPGVFSIVNGGREAVEAICNHSGIKAVAFVGSSPVAKSVYETASANGKRALCLGGAKNAIIVVPDADQNSTPQAILDSFTGCAGQRCMAASLVYAVGNVDAIFDKLFSLARDLKPGPGMGAIIDKEAKAKIEKAIDLAKSEGASIVVDGRGAPPPKGFENGNWLGPTIIDRASPGMACVATEIFGPVLTIVRVRSLDEALSLEEASPFGNATSVFTTSGGIARIVAQRATAGMIGVNVGVPVPREPFSFGGTKDSRFGHGDITGMQGVDFWSSLKKITSRWPEVISDKNWMS